MKISVYCIGKLKESYWVAACNGYIKRINPYIKIEVIEVPDLPIKENASNAEIEEIKNLEGRKVLSKLSPSSYLVSLDLNQKQYDSIEFASHLEKMLVASRSNLNFVIGGSLGLSNELKKRANESICFGKATFPHQLARVMLLEQIYRAFRINNHEPYHK